MVDRDFVAIKARDLTATMGRDYKEDFALQAEFQPGQNETFVDIKILKDDQYEDREYFQLLLEEPQLANVEKPFATTIAITDQDDGVSSHHWLGFWRQLFFTWRKLMLASFFLSLLLQVWWSTFHFRCTLWTKASASTIWPSNEAGKISWTRCPSFATPRMVGRFSAMALFFVKN